MENLELARDLLFTAFGLFTGYVIVAAGKWGADKSVSITRYFLKTPWKWLFTATMLSISGLMATSGYLLEYNVLMFSSIGIAMVGVFSRFKRNKLVGSLHIIGAISGFLGMAVSIWVDFGEMYWGIATISGVTLFWVLTRWNKTVIWNMEIVGVYAIFFTYMYLM